MQCPNSITLFLVLVLTALSVPSNAAEFAPQVIILDAPQLVDNVDKDGSVTFPFMLEGSSATVWLVIYQKDYNATIPLTQNGFMNWHTFSITDTLVYVSDGERFDEGNNTLIWDFMDKNGNLVPWSDYTYYIVAMDQNARIPAAPIGGTWIDGMQIIETDVDGSPLEKPLLYESRFNGYTIKRFALGSDPKSAYESFLIDQSSDPMEGDIAVEPEDHDVVYYQTLNKVAKIRLRSGQKAELVTDWGHNGVIENKTDVTTADFVAACGVEVYGDLVAFSHNNDYPEPVSEIVFVRRSDGHEVRRIDLTAYYVTDNYRATSKGGSFYGVSGPFSFTFHGEDLYTTSFHSPNLIRMKAETGDIIWWNGNGDGFGDKFHPDADPQYANAAEELYLGYYYHVDIDRNGFCYYPDNLSEQKGTGRKATGFVLGPDGSGLFHWTVGDQPNGSNRFDHQVIDSGGPYDGLYKNGIHAATDFIPYRVFQGTLAPSTAVQENESTLPEAFALEQNAPNPFNPETSIGFSLPIAAHTSLKVYDITGRFIRTLADKTYAPGVYSVSWDGKDSSGAQVSAGIYLYTMKAGDFTATGKMLLLK